MSKIKHDEKVGCIFPILPHHVSNIFEKKKPVYAKFTNFNLDDCLKIVFYVSGEKRLVGEAKVNKILKLDPKKLWSTYGKRLHFVESEYLEYIKTSPIGKSERKIKQITAFELNTPKKFETSIKSIFPATPSGRYLTRLMDIKLKHLSK